LGREKNQPPGGLQRRIPKESGVKNLKGLIIFPAMEIGDESPAREHAK